MKVEEQLSVCRSSGGKSKPSRNGPHLRAASDHHHHHATSSSGRSRRDDERRRRSSNASGSSSRRYCSNLTVLQFEPSLPGTFGGKANNSAADSSAADAETLFSVTISFNNDESAAPKRRTSLQSSRCDSGCFARQSSRSDSGRFAGHNDDDEDDDDAGQPHGHRHPAGSDVVESSAAEDNNNEQQDVSPTALPSKRMPAVRRNSFGGLLVDIYRKSSGGGKGAEQHTKGRVADHHQDTQDMEYNVDMPGVAAPGRAGDAAGGEGFVAAKRRPSLKDLLFPFASAHEPDHHHCENKIASFAQKFMKDRGIPLAADKESLSSSEEDTDYDGFEFPTDEQQEVRGEERGEEHAEVVREGGHKSRESERNRRKEKESRCRNESGSVREHHQRSIDEEEKPASSSSSTTKRTRRSSSHRESSSSHRTTRSDSSRSSKPLRSSEPTKEHQSSSFRSHHSSSSSSARRHHSIGTAPRPHMSTSAHGSSSSSSARRHHSIGTAPRPHLTTTSAHGSSSSARRHHSIGTTTRSQLTTTTMLDSDVVAAKSEDHEEERWDFTDCKSVEGDWWDPQPLVSSAAAVTAGPTKRVKTTVRSNVPNAICA